MSTAQIAIEVTANTGAAKQALDELAGATRDTKTAAEGAGKAQKELAKEVAQAKQRQVEATAAVRAAKEAQQEHNLTVQAFGKDSSQAAASSARLKAAQAEAAAAARAANAALEQTAKNVTAVARSEGEASPAVRRMATQLKGMGGDADRTAGELRRLDLQMAATTAKAREGTKSIGGFVTSFAGNVAANVYGSAVGRMQDAAHWIIETGASYETLRIALETTTGSSAKAATEFERLQKFAATTPFSVEELTGAYIKLANRGITPTDRALTSFGNTASAMGKTIDDYVEAVADAITGENERLKEFGIVGKLAGDKVMYTFRGVTTAVKRDATSITDYLTKIGESNFAGGMEKQSQSLAGMWSTMVDNAASLADSLVQGLAPALKETMGDMAAGGEGAKAAAKAFGEDLGEAIRNTTLLVKALYEPLKAIHDTAQDLSQLKSLASGGGFFDIGNWRSIIGLGEEYTKTLSQEALGLEVAEAQVKAYAVAHGGVLDSQSRWIASTLLSAEAQERVNQAVRIGLSLAADKHLADQMNAADAANEARERTARAAMLNSVSKRNEYAELAGDKTLTPAQKKRKNELAKELDVPTAAKGKKGAKKDPNALAMDQMAFSSEVDVYAAQQGKGIRTENEKARLAAYEAEIAAREQNIASIDKEIAAIEEVELRKSEGADFTALFAKETEAEQLRTELQNTRMAREAELAQWQVDNAKTEDERRAAQLRAEQVASQKRLAGMAREAAEEKRLQAQRAAVVERLLGHVESLGSAMADAAWDAAEGQKGAGLMALGEYLKTVAKQMAVKAMVETALGVSALAGIVTAGLAPGHFAAAGLAAAAAVVAGGAGYAMAEGGKARAEEGKGRPTDNAGAGGAAGAGGSGSTPAAEAQALEAQAVPISHEQGRRDLATERALAREVHLHLQINGPVVGAGGIREVGAYLQSALDNYNRGGGDRSRPALA